VKAVWNLDQAYRLKTPTRERVCLNGMWRWQPASQDADAVPAGGWGYFKVPGLWPGGANYIQEDCQTLHVHPDWRNADLRSLRAAWYQREFQVPADWIGRRVTLTAEYVNSLAIVFVDGTRVGVISYPGGEVDLTRTCPPGSKHMLSLLVVALPLKGVLLSYSATNAAREVKGEVQRRGLCGDVWLTSTPAGPRIADLKVDTSVRQGTITLSAALEGLAADVPYVLNYAIAAAGAEPASKHRFQVDFKSTDVQDGRITSTFPWKADKLWDLHTPENQWTVTATLTHKGEERSLDTSYPVRFGFRQFWIDGKDFYLNGTRIFLSAVPLDSAQLGARTASYEGARETMKRLRSFGINYVYMHNYGCEPGSHVSFTEILRAADDLGMLVGFSQPHFGHYDWKGKDADRANSYARHAEFYVRAAQNHPSVVAYVMSHNATGYDEDMNPDRIDGKGDPRKDTWSQNNARLALRAEAIVHRLDPRRIVYHHSSGNLGSMHTCNFYLNFVPIQEVSDWFEHWATAGVKPMFAVEYGVPFSWDWTMYRGWYQGERNFGSARVPWEFCLAEWNAQFVGERAYRISEREKQNLRFEARQFREGKLWHRWDYPHPVGSRDFDERAKVFARYLTENWRAFRTWGLSANSPWEYQIFWKLRNGVSRVRREFPADWEHLQKPGFSPDFTQRQNWQMDTDFEPTDWLPTAAAEALLRNNRPLLAYLAGKRGAFTSKDHNYLPGETVEKQLIVINNSRETVSAKCLWTLRFGEKQVTVRTGEQERIPLQFLLSPNMAPGTSEISATVRFSTGETQSDKLAIHVLPAPAEVYVASRIALFDPKGETASLLRGLNVNFTKIDARSNLASFDVLILGRNALTIDGPAPDIRRVRDGLKVIVFEQSAKVLEQRFGFRVAEYGLREVFPRVPDHPLLANLRAEHLRDWRGEATLLPSRLEYTLRPRHGPTVQWCGLDVSRVWRCGCRGNVASVLLEKPARGDFLPILDGGYALRYSPLLEYREGKGLVLFCQVDVTGRTESDPAADHLVRNLLTYVATWQPRSHRKVLYAGDPLGCRHLLDAGIATDVFRKDALTADSLLILGPQASLHLVGQEATLASWLQAGGHLLAVGLTEHELKPLLPFPVKLKKAEHIAAYFDAAGRESAFAGISSADVHNRDPRVLDLIDAGMTILGDGILAQSSDGRVVCCQLVPWQFDGTRQMNLKRTFRRTSYTLSRLATNLGAASETPLLDRFHTPVAAGERRWERGLYLDLPGEWDDPYRFFRW
jgi:hypothetical protein